MGQSGNTLCQHAAIVLNVAGADLEKIVEAAGDHVACFDLGHCQHGLRMARSMRSRSIGMGTW